MEAGWNGRNAETLMKLEMKRNCPRRGTRGTCRERAIRRMKFQDITLKRSKKTITWSDGFAEKP